MEWTQVTSSSITAMRHRGTTLEVLFTSGVSYRYANVSEQLFKELLNSPSVGSAFSSRIKKNPGEYPFEKVQA